MIRQRIPRAAIALCSAIVLGLAGAVLPAHAQVSLEVGNGEIVIRNEGFKAQRAYKSTGKNDGKTSQWFVEDEVGNSYEACTRTCYVKEDGTWSCGGFQSDDGVAPEIVSGYSDALQHLVDTYGAVVEHDDILGIDYVSFPESEDPYQTLVDALLNDYVNGILLLEYFKSLEISTKGPNYTSGSAAKPTGAGHDFLNDPFIGAQWNLNATRLFEAAHYGFASKLDRPVRIGLIDSGIDARFAGHVGLDGVTQIVHRWTANTTGFASAHALGIATLLADAANDGNGIAGLIGSWTDGCDVMDSRPSFEIYSYNVGDFGPVNYLVARAIRAATEDEVDVINLSMRIAFSPLVQSEVEAALEKGIVVVAAAGNYHPGAKHKPTGFPASIPGVIAVAGTDMNLLPNAHSANEGFDVAAPGYRIVFGGPDDIWLGGDGTSLAAPHVTAAAAILKAADPNLNSEDVSQVLQSTGRARGQQTAFLDALAAVESVLGPDATGHQATGDCSAGKGGLTDADSASPTRIELLGNYPNPFNPATTITFQMSEAGEVHLHVYDVMGRLVRTLVDESMSAGEHDVRFDAANLPSGVYYYQLESPSSTLQGSMTLLR